MGGIAATPEAFHILQVLPFGYRGHKICGEIWFGSQPPNHRALLYIAEKDQDTTDGNKLTVIQLFLGSSNRIRKCWTEIFWQPDGYFWWSQSRPRLHWSKDSNWITLSLVESFIESEVPHLRLFLVKSMMPLKRWVATEKVLTPLLGNEVWFKFFM